MTIKQFLKPDWRKIKVVMILLILTNFGFLFLVLMTTAGDAGYFDMIGLPLGFVKLSICSNLSGVVSCGGGFFSLPFLIINIIFWYLLSCLIIWIYDKFRKKK
jgi:hypothetical protein